MSVPGFTPTSSQTQRARQRALANCAQLSRISASATDINRQYLTDEHRRCNQQVAEWMSAAGLHTWQDAVGNQWGRLASNNPNAPRLILGSHLDTVPNAGAFDGILGVLLAIEVAAWWRQQTISLPFHLDIVGFCDEEGSRFGVTLIGSRALCGSFDPAWLSVCDADGISMASALREFGLDPDRVAEATLPTNKLLGFWELHIEQGPVLEAENLSVGVVTGIAGARRGYLTLQGQAGHAGTTPMQLRRDAICGAAEVILEIERLAKTTDGECVATVGELTARPGAVNVIAGEVCLSLDVRSLDDAARDQLITAIESATAEIAGRRQLEVTFQWHHNATAVGCDQDFMTLVADAVQRCDLPVTHLPSGAGHDAMAMAAICPVAMLFLRSPRGLSHHPDESVVDVDVDDGFRVLCQAVRLFAQSND